MELLNVLAIATVAGIMILAIALLIIAIAYAMNIRSVVRYRKSLEACEQGGDED